MTSDSHNDFMSIIESVHIFSIFIEKFRYPFEFSLISGIHNREYA